MSRSQLGDEGLYKFMPFKQLRLCVSGRHKFESDFVCQNIQDCTAFVPHLIAGKHKIYSQIFH